MKVILFYLFVPCNARYGTFLPTLSAKMDSWSDFLANLHFSSISLCWGSCAQFSEFKSDSKKKKVTTSLKMTESWRHETSPITVLLITDLLTQYFLTKSYLALCPPLRPGPQQPEWPPPAETQSGYQHYKQLQHNPDIQHYKQLKHNPDISIISSCKLIWISSSSPNTCRQIVKTIGNWNTDTAACSHYNHY